MVGRVARSLPVIFLGGLFLCAQAQEPLVLFEFGCQTVRLDGNKLIVSERLAPIWQTVPGVHQRLRLDGKIWDVTQKEWEEGIALARSRSVFSRLRVSNGILYLDGIPVDLGADCQVSFVTEAVPWGSGILCFGRTMPKRTMGFFRTLLGLTGTSEKAREDFNREFTRTIEPWCAIYVDPASHRGTDLWISGKVPQRMVALKPPR